MPNLKCPRCEYITNKRSHMLNHYNRKYPCTASSLDVSIDECIKQLSCNKNKLGENQHKINTKIIGKNIGKNNNNIIDNSGILPSYIECEHCNKHLSCYKSLWRHMKYYCKYNNIVSSDNKQLDEARQVITELKDEIKEMKCMFENILNNISTSSTISTNINSNNINSNNTLNNTTININVYGNEDVGHITQDLVKFLAQKKPGRAIPIMANEIYAKKKENNTVVLAGGHKSGKVKVHKGNNKWVYRNKSEVINEMGTKVIDVMSDKYERLDESKFAKIQDQFETFKNPTYNNNCKSISLILDNIYENIKVDNIIT